MCLSRDKATVPKDRRAPKWWLGRNDGDPIIRPLPDKEMGASHPRCQNQKRLYARIESDLVGFFKLVGSVFGGAAELRASI